MRQTFDQDSTMMLFSKFALPQPVNKDIGIKLSFHHILIHQNKIFSTTVLQHFVSEKKKVQLFINYRTIHVFNQRAVTVGN